MKESEKSELKIEAVNIKKSFDNSEIIKDMTIKVYKGEFVSVLGPSGCGKSTLFNIISGLIKPDVGSVKINGELSYMYQKDLLLPHKTVIDNVSLPLILKKEKRDDARNSVKEYFRMFGLEGYENKYPSEMSGGMRQRANFMRTYINSNDIMLLDEPFGALDSITRESMQKWLLGLRKIVKSTILLITHDIEEAIYLSDRIYIVSDKPAYIKCEIKVDSNNKDNPEYIFGVKRKILDILNV